MLSHRIKTMFFNMAGPLMRVNGYAYHAFLAPRSGTHKVQLGPGQKNYLNGWINLDANIFTARCDVWIDLRNPLPFHDSTIAAMYSHHVVEHLPDIESHFCEVYRCLKPGGVYRVGGPNGDAAITKFLENDSDWFSDFPDKYSSIGGRLQNYIFCRREHLSILTLSFLEELMTKAGFVCIQACVPTRDTAYPELFNESLALEWEWTLDCPHTLIVEAQKPASSM